MSLQKFLMAGMFATVFVASTAQAAVIVRFNEELLNGPRTGGTVVVSLESTTPPENVGSYDLDLLFSNFTGNLVGQQVTVSSFTFNTGVFQTTPLVPGSFSSGGTTAFAGALLPPVALTVGQPSASFVTIAFSVPTALGLGDTFTVGLQPTGQIVGAAGGFNNIYGGMSPQVVGTAIAVPEPSTYAFCGLVVAGLAYRRRMKTKAA